MTLGLWNERRTKHHSSKAGWIKRLISWPHLKATNHRWMRGSTGVLILELPATHSTLSSFWPPTCGPTAREAHRAHIGQTSALDRMYSSAGLLVGMDILSLCSFVRIVGGMGPALIGANERSRGGSHSEVEPSMQPHPQAAFVERW